MKDKTIDEYIDDVMIGLLDAVEYTKEADTKLMREVIGNTLRQVKNLTIPHVMLSCPKCEGKNIMQRADGVIGCVDCFHSWRHEA